MCGIAGLFSGCAAFATCPLEALRAPAAPEEGTAYRSPLASWHERASVRRAPRRILDTNGARHLLFSPEMVPLATHPLVLASPPARSRRCSPSAFYRYLDFTTKLEHLVVNRTVAGIAHDEVGFEVPDEMAFDAYKIYCDEAYHALFAADLLRQARALSGITPLLEPQPYFIQRLRAIQAAVGQGLEPLVELLFVVCSETLITASLASMPDNPSVVEAVRDIVRDHAHDEGRHHAYFTAFLRILWLNLTPAMRREMGVLIPDLIDAFLRPDVTVLRVELAGYGLSCDDAEQVLAEVYADDVMRPSWAATASQTVFHFAEIGALDDPATRDAFAGRGFLPEGAS